MEVLNRYVPGVPQAGDLQDLWRHVKENRPTTAVGWLTWGTVGLAGTTVCSAAVAGALSLLCFASVCFIGFISIASILIGTWLGITAILGFFAVLALGSLTVSAAIAQLAIRSIIKYAPILYHSVQEYLTSLGVPNYVNKGMLNSVLGSAQKPKLEAQQDAGSVTSSGQQAAAPARPAPAASATSTSPPKWPPSSTADTASVVNTPEKQVPVTDTPAVHARPTTMVQIGARGVDTIHGGLSQARPVRDLVA